MASESFEVGIVAVRRVLSGPWADHAWAPHSVLPAVPEVAPWTRLSADGSTQVFYAGPVRLTLHGSDTAHYRDNLSGDPPKVWVALRPVGGDEVEIAGATVDPYEGEAMADGMGDVVEAVPMPAEVAARVAAFFEAHHVEREFVKRKRDRADPEALARRGPGGRGGRE